MWRTHIAFGLLSGLLFFKHFGATWFVFLPLAMIGSLFPDVDHENSKINKILPVTKIVPTLFKHRGFFHSIWPAMIFYFGFHLARLDYIGIPLAIGYIAHLVSDGLTEAGCNLLHPITTMRIQGFIRTNGIMEHATFGIILVANVLLVLKIFR